MKNALEQFRQQLATWINLRLSEHRLPFQKLEICPEIVTELGKLQPDMVLWINRDSQLAGSVILLPNVGDATICQYGRAMARALGLGHFTVWAAREVTIWDTAVNPVRLKTFSFPPAGEVDPIDFHHTLDALLEELKVVAITSAPENSALSTDYYVNLCLQTLQGLSPGLVESTRLTAGQNAADAWVNQTPQEKAWLSLWRLLFLLRQDLLPTGLQPERIEAALGYALEESSASSPLLKIQDSEPPLPESCAVRLHHLSGRLRQLGWPHSNQEAKETIDRLLSEAAQQFNLAATNLPWDISAQLWIKVPPRCEAPKPSIVAPKGFLAGWDNPLCHSGDKTTLQAQNVYELPASQSFEGIVALLDDQESPTRSERNHRQLSLRQTWPNRRFDLPRTAPRWLWDLLHLAGMDATDLHLILPYDWRFASGIDLLWPELTRDFQLIEAATLSSTQQALRWRRQKASHSQISFHRQEQTLQVPATLLAQQQPGLIQLWLTAELKVLQLLLKQQLQHFTHDPVTLEDKTAWGIFLFCHTQLGRYLRQLIGGTKPLEDVDSVVIEALSLGMPLPNATILSTLGDLLGCRNERTLPTAAQLEQAFQNLFGEVPALPAEAEAKVKTSSRSPRSKQETSLSAIADSVFVDGVPSFPEHYLMQHYRPKLQTHRISEQLEIAESFFDKIRLQNSAGDFAIEVSGMTTAEALVLASCNRSEEIQLPVDDALIDQITRAYRKDLGKLWDTLVRECRRVEPRRLVAQNLARRIWRKHKLPPENLFDKKDS